MEDIKSFERFFSYEPTFDEDPAKILEEILQKAKKYLKKEDLQAIQDTYLFTKAAHE
jgi:DNA polymerase III delta prime subunit